MRKQQGIKLFLVMVICTVFMYSFSHFGALAYNAVTTDSDQYEKGTAVGSIDLTGKTKSEALTTLTEQQQKWRSETTLQIQYKEKTIPIEIEIYHFDLENTIELIVNGQKNPINVTIKASDIENMIKEVSPELTLTKDEINLLTNELMRYAVELTPGNHTIALEKLITSTAKQETINQAELKLFDISVEMTDWIKALSPIVIEPKGNISLAKVFEEKELEKMPDSIKSMIATGIYEVILPTNFTVIERHTSQSLPEYAKLGYEANIDVKNNRDLLFLNPNSSSYEIELQWMNNTLVIQLKGSKFLYDYKVNLGETQQYKPKTIVQYNPLLKSGIQVQQEGTNGLLVKVYREVNGEAGELIDKVLVAEDYYPPVHRIEIHRLPSTSTPKSGDPTGTNETPPSTETTDSTPSDPNNPSQPTKEDELEDDLWGKPDEAKK